MSPLFTDDTTPWDFRGVLGVTVRLMSDGELARIEVLRDLDQRGLTTEAAGQLWGSNAARYSGY
jgi:hypothetical protein